MPQAIKFLLGDEPRQLSAIDPTMTVLDYLRINERLTGTKEGCAEGDCGACTIVIGELEGDKIRYRAVNSCIQFLPSLEGKQLIPVEELVGDDGALHPVQQAMVDTDGSQCGFCTPGFVMSLFALYQESDEVPTLEAVNDALAGNLCRCTGYGPIIAAAQAMHGLGEGPDKFAKNAKATAAALKSMQHDETIHIKGPDGRQAFAPATAQALAGILAEHPEATLVAGATDVGLWVTKALRQLDPVIYIDRVGDLQSIEDTDEEIRIGAGVTYAKAHEIIAEHYPDFGEVVRRLGSPPVRNVGTIGGNIANGSPIGDSMPPLIAAGATLILRRDAGLREMPLEDFFIAYGKQDLKPGEFVEAVVLPKPPAGSRLLCYKISKRFDQDISALLGAFNLSIRDGLVETARLAFGGMADTPKRALASEAAIIGQPWSQPTVEAAMAALKEDFAPIDDLRASADYRMRVAQNLLMKAFLETGEARFATRLVENREVAHG